MEIKSSFPRVAQENNTALLFPLGQFGHRNLPLGAPVRDVPLNPLRNEVQPTRRYHSAKLILELVMHEGLQ